jgi:hypothetical protein
LVINPLFSCLQHPTPAFFASFQPRQWASFAPPPGSRPFPSGAPFLPSGPGPSHHDYSGEEQWEEFEWSEAGGAPFSAGSGNDWGSAANAGVYGSPGGGVYGSPGAGLTGPRAPIVKGKMKPDAPEFVPKAVLLAKTQGTAAPTSSSRVEAKPLVGEHASGSKDVGSSSGASGKGKAETQAGSTADGAPGSVSSAAAGKLPDTSATTTLDAAQGSGSTGSSLGEASGKAPEVGQRPVSALKRGQVAADRGAHRPASAPQAMGGADSAEPAVRPASAPRAARETEEKETERPVSAPKTGGIVGQGSGGGSFSKIESARDLLGVAGTPRARSASPVVMPASLQAVQAGRHPLLTRPPVYMIGLVRGLRDAMWP